MTDLETQEQQIITPTGQVIDLADPADVAIALDDLGHLKRMVAEIEGKLKRALIDHSTELGKKTFELEGVAKITIKGERERRFDPHGLKRDLKAAGCPPERISEIVRETIEYKVMAVQANQAAKANPAYAEAIEKNSTVEDKNPSVTVTRIGGRSGLRLPAGRGEVATPAPADALDEALPWE